MIDVSRETFPRASLEPFLTFLKSRGPLQGWIGSGTGDPPALKNVHLALVPFLVSLLDPDPARPLGAGGRESPLLCLFPEGSREDLNVVFQHLSALTPRTVATVTDSALPRDDEIESPTDAWNPPLENLLNRLYRGDLCVVLATDKTWGAIRLKAPRDGSEHMVVSQGILCSPPRLKRVLAGWGYQQVDRVLVPGSFAVRGGIMDVFGLEHSMPVRLEFVGDTIESSRLFDPVSQRTSGPIPDERIVLSRPLRLSSTAGGKSPTSIFSQRVRTLLLISAGPSHSYHLTPPSRSADGSADLACVSHGPFDANGKLWKDLNVQLEEKQIVNRFIFYHPDYRGRLRSLPAPKELVPIAFPLAGSFSSSALKLFCASLEQVEGLPTPASGAGGRPPTHVPSLEDFPWGGPVVHEDFGIGLYRGLSRVKAGDQVMECVTLEYAGGDRVHVPLDRLARVHTYVGSSTKAPELSSLRTSHWQRLKQRTQSAAEKVVDEFINLYARRQRLRGTAFSPDVDLHLALKNSFPYEETPDQITAYDHIRKAMERAEPMDWLLCGDVGFGKTEIALRAAFKAAYDHRQVAVLAPTTILANQLFVAFKSRVEPLGISVAMLSRFSPESHQRQTIERLKRGTLDIIVGTHRLLSRDVEIPNLGLVIIDEEHRFGARHKERLKQMRASVDVLAMSATPIPRTLTFSLLGIRDISSIRTPPRERLPIITRLLPPGDGVIRRAIRFELARDGQVFFIHNDIETLDRVAGELQSLLPGVRIGIAHGQLPGRTLESVMLKFLLRDLDVLVCTTIIEAGIDLPNVNTIFIDNAHRFGLAQIYQMRGRVGRSNRQAYCYLFLPRGERVSATAYDRLMTLEFFSSLGSGYAIALKDLELRGAGNLFGTEQSGHVASVGFHLYCKIVEQAANASLAKAPSSLPRRPMEVSFQGPALIPPGYVEDLSDRLYFYRLLAEARDTTAVDEVRRELEDRFGPPPPECRNLLWVAALQARGTDMGIKRLTISPKGARATFDPALPAKTIQSLARKFQDRMKTLGLAAELSDSGTNGIQLRVPAPTVSRALQAAEYLFESFRPSSNFDPQ